ncbi:MAG: DUF4783 domain-containing protein [Bacteroidales bacterium]|jgi:hypothetical protein|nr:DUF4783 domain-containing protein [Bacteroidales bacterium]
MRIIFAIIITVALSAYTNVSAQSVDIPDEITLAFKAGNVDVLSEYLNSTVELALLDKEDFYTRKIAEDILKDFFRDHATTDFVIKHKGGRAESAYAIGTLRTRKGNFRVYFLIKKIDSKPLIHQLRIEKDDTGGDS